MEDISVIQLCISDQSKSLGIDKNLSLSIAYCESRFNPYVVSFESKWSYFYNVPQFSTSLVITRASEQALQSMSWGPLQVMGSVCRELGYLDYLNKLGTDYSQSILYGLLKIKSLINKYSDIHDVVSSYNQGSPIKRITGLYKNQEYVDNVMRYYSSLIEGGG
jgi:hypothetical protein